MQKNLLETALLSYFHSKTAFTFSKGRVALFAALKALGLAPGDEIIIPGYTCVVVPGAVKFLSGQPVYVDIDRRTYNIDPDSLESACSPRTRAIIIQHTYGIPARMDRLVPWAARKNISIIEDCCHAFGSRFDGRLTGTFGAASFFSGQWNKPFTTGLGGMLVIPESPLAETLSKAVEELLENETLTPGVLKQMAIWGQIQAYRLVVGPRTNSYITMLYRALAKWGLMIGSSTQAELRGEKPEDYLSRMSPCQSGLGYREMGRLAENISARKENARYYDRHLEEIGFEPLKLNSGEDAVLVRYPVRVGNKAELLQLAPSKGIELGSWFDSPLHPGKITPGVFGYHRGMCPESESACREVVNLPTHRSIGPKERDRVLAFLARHAETPQR